MGSVLRICPQTRALSIPFARTGTWLSILSGWRRDRVTHVDLQMNDSRFKKESLSAVMRAFMLEHEITCKQQLIDFVGGTSLLLRRYCRPIEPCTDIFLWRPCLRAILSKNRFAAPQTGQHLRTRKPNECTIRGRILALEEMM
jgi:hypothetical protein